MDPVITYFHMKGWPLLTGSSGRSREFPLLVYALCFWYCYSQFSLCREKFKTRYFCGKVFSSKPEGRKETLRNITWEVAWAPPTALRHSINYEALNFISVLLPKTFEIDLYCYLWYGEGCTRCVVYLHRYKGETSSGSSSHIHLLVRSICLNALSAEGGF